MRTSNENLIAPTHYIGVGASAGGLEALQEFFSHVPSDTGACFIVIQHLSPDFKSMMPELLKKYTGMPIKAAQDGLALEPNCIYLMPPRSNIHMNNGVTGLSEYESDGKVHLPIDIFLSSLAKDQRHKAVAIVLSGTGSDGTRGIKSVKEAGGLVIVQEPSSAKFDGMPVSAYNTGFADMLLPPGEIGTSLVKFINHPLISDGKSALKESISDNADILSSMFLLLKKQSSINFSMYKESTVARRIERRMGINQISSIESYMQLLKESPRELQVLSKELLIGVTCFFRDDDAFDKISKQIIPNIVRTAKEKGEGIRTWVAGCSTGEEAYSLAMLIDEERRRQKYDCQTKIFATDVDEDAIAFASAGEYSEQITHEISAERIESYFNKKENSYSVKKHLRQMVIFAKHNMIEDAPFSNINFISCRNVLIYFQHLTQKKVLSSLYFALQRNGYLFLGSSESLGDLQTHFNVIDERLKIFTRSSDVRVPMSNASPLRENIRSNLIDTPYANVNAPIRLQERSLLRNSLQKVNERLIKDHSPDCIIINDMFDAVHVYGNVSSYTRGVTEGRVSNNIKDIIREEIAVAINTALHRCEKTGEDVFYNDINVKLNNDESLDIDLSIILVKDGDLVSSPYYYVIQFIKKDLFDHDRSSIKGIAFDPNEQTRQRIDDLEQELIKKQEHLQITIEELETTNEELQSANEELMSANEELQSTNEELQSVNEELYTVNSEYQEKIYELTEANDDLDSIINATDLGIIFLDQQLTIRKYTPNSIEYFNIRDQDIGRPFHHLSHTLCYDNLLNDIVEVNKKNTVFQKEISNQDGNALLLKIIPYHSRNKNDHVGILITITNISRLRFVEDALKLAQEKIRSSLLKSDQLNISRIPKKEEINLLLLDDSDVDRTLVKELISAHKDRHVSVFDCSDIESAMTFCKKLNFDIFLVDYNLGVDNAKDFFMRLKERNINTPMIVMSGFSEKGLDAVFLKNDVVDFLDKESLTSQLLISSIDYALDRGAFRNMLNAISTDEIIDEA